MNILYKIRHVFIVHDLSTWYPQGPWIRPADSPSIHELLGIRRRLATDQPLDAHIGGIQATAEAVQLGFDEVVQLPLPQPLGGIQAHALYIYIYLCVCDYIIIYICVCT